MKPVVRNIQNNDFYFYEGENNFTNIRTGKTGNVDDDMSRKVFKMNIEATEIINEFPLVEKMISILNLKFDNNKK